MRSIKLTKNMILNNLASIKYETIIKNIKNFINEHASSMSKCNFNIENNKIILVEPVKDYIEKFIGNIDVNSYVNKKLIRTIKLNLTFNKKLKTLELSNENINNFPDFNTINYEISCKENFKNSSVFFQESSLVNYYEDTNVEEYVNCEYVLFILFYTKQNIIYNSLMNISQTIISNEHIFLCYNIKTKKLEDNIYEKINNSNDESLDIHKFIELFNSNLLKNNEIFTKIIDNQNENIIKTIKFVDLSYSITYFILLNKEMTNFIDFKYMSNANIFNNFLKIMKKKSIQIL